MTTWSSKLCLRERALLNCSWRNSKASTATQSFAKVSTPWMPWGLKPRLASTSKTWVKAAESTTFSTSRPILFKAKFCLQALRKSRGKLRAHSSRATSENSSTQIQGRHKENPMKKIFTLGLWSSTKCRRRATQNQPGLIKNTRLTNWDRGSTARPNSSLNQVLGPTFKTPLRKETLPTSWESLYRIQPLTRGTRCLNLELWTTPRVFLPKDVCKIRFPSLF